MWHRVTTTTTNGLESESAHRIILLYIIIYYYILLLLLLRVVVRSPRYAHKQYAHMHTLLAGRPSRPGRTPRGLFPLRASPDSRPDLVNGLPPILCNLHVVIMAVSGGHS